MALCSLTSESILDDFCEYKINGEKTVHEFGHYIHFNEYVYNGESYHLGVWVNLMRLGMQRDTLERSVSNGVFSMFSNSSFDLETGLRFCLKEVDLDTGIVLRHYIEGYNLGDPIGTIGIEEIVYLGSTLNNYEISIIVIGSVVFCASAVVLGIRFWKKYKAEGTR